MSDEAPIVRGVGPGDFAWILELINHNQRANVPENERSARGFIQGSFTVASLTQRLAGPGMWVAEVQGVRAGVVLSSSADACPAGPPARSIEVAAAALPGMRLFLYGPAVVDSAFRGRGVLRALIGQMFADAETAYDEAIAFVERGNTLSLSVHAQLGFREVGTFTIEDRDYVVLAHPTRLR